MNRREAVTLMGTSAALIAAKGVAMPSNEGGTQPPAVKPGSHQAQPLSFDPAKLKGLSEKLLRSHHENNYGGAVKNLNKVEGDLAALAKDAPGYLVSGLRERELTFTNSLILHEAYFGNLGGDGKAAGGIEKAIAQAFGSFSTWEEQFRALAGGLAGGSGWAVLDYNFQTGALRSYWSGQHTQAVAFGMPLLVLDMYEHAYAMDYGAAAAKYVDAFFLNLRWEEVDRRLSRAVKAAAALKG